MDTAVLWIYQEVKDQHGNPLEAGQKPSLCFRGTKHMLCVVAGHPVRVLKRTVKDFDKARHVTQNGGDYPVEKAFESLWEISNRNGITDAARKLLRHSEDNREIREEEFTDEEEVSTLTQPTKEQEDDAELESENAARKRSGGPSVLGKICEDLKIDPGLARRTLRKAGLSAPYDDEAAIRAVLK